MPSRQAQRQRPKATKTAAKPQTAVKAAAVREPVNISQQYLQETPVRNASAAGALALSPILSTETLTFSTSVTQTESLEITKTILHSSISSLAFLRDLLPTNCYGEHCYDVTKGVVPYNEFVQRSDTHRPGESSLPKFRIMRRGCVDKVDAFLDVLEHGVFDCLSKNYLHALELIITSSPSAPLKVLEKYTYYIHYSPSGALEGLSISGTGERVISVKTLKLDMRTLLKQIIEFDRVLPRLPSERYLVVQIHYTNGCPSTYEPPGFSETDDTILHAADARGWKNERVRFGSVYTGFHSTTLVGSILQHETGLDLLPQNLVFEPVSNTIPDDVALTPPLPNTGHTAIPGVSNSDPTSQGRSQAPDYPLPTRPARVERSPVIPTQSIEHEDSSILLTHPHLSSQAREDKAVQAKLNELLDLSSVTIQTEDAQALQNTLPLISGFEESGLTRERDSYESEAYESGSHSFGAALLKPPQLRLSQVRLDALESLHSEHNRTAQESNVDIVSCQCGWQEDEGVMIECKFCQQWQHLLCYGYIGPGDPRLPEIFACNVCLLGASSKLRENELRSLSLVRNSIKILFSNGYGSRNEFAKELHCDVRTAGRITDLLAKEGLLVPIGRGHGRSKARTDRKYNALDRGAVFDRVMKKYFDPTLEIALFFESESAAKDVQHQPLVDLVAVLPKASAVRAKLQLQPDQEVTEPAELEFTTGTTRGQSRHSLEKAAKSRKVAETSIQHGKRSRQEDGGKVGDTPVKRLRASAARNIFNVALKSPSP